MEKIPLYWGNCLSWAGSLQWDVGRMDCSEQDDQPSQFFQFLHWKSFPPSNLPILGTLKSALNFQHVHRLTSSDSYNKPLWFKMLVPHFTDHKTEESRSPMTAKDHKYKESGRARIQSQICPLWSWATSNNPTPCLVLLCIDGHENKSSGAVILESQALCAQSNRKETRKSWVCWCPALKQGARQPNY